MNQLFLTFPLDLSKYSDFDFCQGFLSGTITRLLLYDYQYQQQEQQFHIYLKFHEEQLQREIRFLERY